MSINKEKVRVIAMHDSNSVDVYLTEQEINSDVLLKVKSALLFFPGQFCCDDEIRNACWDLHVLSNGGFYFKPKVIDEQKKYTLSISANYGEFESELNADEIGIVISSHVIHKLCTGDDFWNEYNFWNIANDQLWQFVKDHPNNLNFMGAIVS